MIMKRTFALAGSLLILGLSFAFAQEQSQLEIRNEVRNEVQTKNQDRVRNRILFVDENGDGISDFARDHDNDGIPNCQDPDWTRPEDGTGYMNRNKNASSSSQFEHRNRYYSGKGLNKASFRNSIANSSRGTFGACASKGKASKHGRR
jgi:hypothetical protein